MTNITCTRRVRRLEMNDNLLQFVTSLIRTLYNSEVIIEKHWRGVTSRSVCDFFWDEVNKHETREDMPPIIATSTHYLISIYREGVFLLATTTAEVAPLLVLEFLHRVFDIFAEYLGGTVEESSVKENFATVYQLLEEMMDYGYPLTTEPNALRDMIKPTTVISRLTSAALGGASAVSDVLPDGTISNMPWRKTGVKYTNNEIYLDIIEEVDATLDRHGGVVQLEVGGSIQANSMLSGVPDLCLAFANPELIDDCSFHPCVRYTRFDRDRLVSFVPPDGQFELMRYSVKTPGGVSLPCYVQPLLSFDSVASTASGPVQGSLSVTVGQRAMHSLLFPGLPTKPALVVEDVCVVIPFSRAVRTASLTVSAGSGTVLFDESTKIARWTIGKLSADKVAQLTGTIQLQTSAMASDGLASAPALELHWRVPTASVSGLCVASLQLTGETYKPFKGVRTVAQAGRLTVRMT